MADNTKRKQRMLVLAFLGTAALVLQAYLNLPSFNAGLDDSRSLLPLDELEEEWKMHRLLAEIGKAADGNGDYSIPDWLLHVSEENQLSASQVMDNAIQQDAQTPHSNPILPSYNIIDAVENVNLFMNTYAVMVYDPPSNLFKLLYPDGQKWSHRCTKLMMSFESYSYILRATFPDRFCGEACDEWAVGISSGDYPNISLECLAHYPNVSENCAQHTAPVLQFGSAYKSFDILPNMIAMPVPIANGLPAFKTWVINKGESVSPHFRGRDNGGVLVFGDDLEWENLKPQVVWRGTDWGYLNYLYMHRTADDGQLRMPSFDSDIPQEIHAGQNVLQKSRDAVQAMRNIYPNLLPRWKGVVLTSEANLEVNQSEDEKLPWIDAKFTGRSPAARGGASPYEGFEKLGITATGKRMELNELVKYKYHINIGGGGGTTWTGTVHKLAMPGLLFHHMTPTKDYIHDRIKPWIHFIPVRADLTDLKEKYDWAEAHPEYAKLISEQATKLMRRLGTIEGFGEMFQENFVDPTRSAMEAYTPVSVTHPGKTWREVLKSAQSTGDIRGIKMRADCTGGAPKPQRQCKKISPAKNL